MKTSKSKKSAGLDLGFTTPPERNHHEIRATAVDNLSQTIHDVWHIYYIYHQNKLNVGKYTKYMDDMGMNMLLFWMIWIIISCCNSPKYIEYNSPKSMIQLANKNNFTVSSRP